MQYIIGVDIGTTNIKAVVISAGGETVHEVREDNRSSSPQPGYHEQDPRQIVEVVLEVMQQAINRLPDKKALRCICFSAAMHSVMAVDKNGGPLTPLLTWADTRSTRYAEILTASGKGTLIYKRTGVPIHPMSPLCKIAWIKDELPVVFANTAKYISIKEYVLFRFFGRWLVDYSIASASGLFDNDTLQWDAEALAFAGINRMQLSEPVTPLHQLIGLEETIQTRLGLQKDIPFVIGASDGALANIGSGAVLPAEAALTIGTSGAVRRISLQSDTATQHGLFNYRIDDDWFLSGGAINNGGNVLQWVAQNFTAENTGDSAAYEKVLAMAAAAPPGSGGLIFLPYLFGERSPVWDARAKGAFIGLNDFHTRAHMSRAVLEGISFSLLSIIYAIEKSSGPVELLYASGGFTRSAIWLQLLADITGKTIKVCRAADASSLGAALMGMRATGWISNWQEVKRYITYDGTFYTNPANHETYLQCFAVYEPLYDKLKKTFAAIDVLQQTVLRQ
jgi:gluconokinase